MKKIGQRFIPVAKPALIGKEAAYVNDCLDTTWISSRGKYLEQFEKAFAKYLGVKYAISCGNGTEALHLAMLASGIGPGDEVICPSLTYVATANCIRYVGATPVFADCEEETLNIDVKKLPSLITKRTKAIIPVHLYGYPCDMEPIRKIAQAKGLLVIEDSAEALGAEYHGKKCGGLSDIGTFSFFGNKTITTGEGGMVVTNNARFNRLARLYRGQGLGHKQYWFEVIGYNYRMTNIQAALGLGQLENINVFLAKRIGIAKWYSKKLKGVIGVSMPEVKPYAKHSYWMCSILVDRAQDRDALMVFLKNRGIETRPFFPPLHLLPMYKKKNIHLPVTESMSKRGISLPTFYDLSENDVEYITENIKVFLKKR